MTELRADAVTCATIILKQNSRQNSMIKINSLAKDKITQLDFAAIFTFKLMIFPSTFLVAKCLQSDGQRHSNPFCLSSGHPGLALSLLHVIVAFEFLSDRSYGDILLICLLLQNVFIYLIIVFYLLNKLHKRWYVETSCLL